MQHYFMKNRISEHADAWGLNLLMLLGALAIFISLWGIRLPSFTAGAALYLFWVILRRKGQLQRTRGKEKSLRQRIGGEMMLEKMLLQNEQLNHMEIARLLTKDHSARTLSQTEYGVWFSSASGKRILIRYLPLHADDTLRGADVAAAQRMCLKQNGNQIWLCVPGKISPQAIGQSALHPPVCLIERETLIKLIGSAYPATDRDLSALHRRMHRTHPRRQWIRELFCPENAQRFARFAALMASLLFLTGQTVYAFSALWMMTLAALCRCMHARRKKAPPFRDA
ncbi:MAG: hypothetical protein IKT57_07010 [Clostridia bacterium]|nr:hypothetical protein [Clostridia bacterium]